MAVALGLTRRLTEKHPPIAVLTNEALQEEELVELPRVRDAGWALYL